MENITSQDIDNAILDIRSHQIDSNDLDSLSYLFLKGDSTVFLDIQKLVKSAQKKLKRKNRYSNKRFPIDLSVGYYSNTLDLEFSDANISSTNGI